MIQRASLACLLLAFCAVAQEPALEVPSDGKMPTFGTTVVVPGGFCGEIFHISRHSDSLPNFEKLEPVGAIYTSRLYIPPRSWDEGFPGVTTRFEWFAIDYRARFWVDTPGKHLFYLMSDDGAKLYIDKTTVIDNDGLHGPLELWGSVILTRGIHNIRVTYFQGPRLTVALVVGVLKPGEKDNRMRAFDTNEFRPPADVSESDITADTVADPRRRKLKLKKGQDLAKRTCADSR